MSEGLCSQCFGAGEMCEACEYDHDLERRVSRDPLDDAETVARIGEIAGRIRSTDEESAHRIEDALTRAVLRELARGGQVGIDNLRTLLAILHEPRARWFA